MGTYLRVTPALRSVVGCLLEAETEVWGLLVVTRTGRPTGTVYPLLERLERAGLVTSHWEQGGERAGSRRRLYALSETGRAWAGTRGLCPAPDEKMRTS